MSNLDNLINKAKGFINLAGKKTGDIVEISKLKIDRANKNAELQKNYELLGKLCYSNYKSSSDNQDSIGEIIKKIELLEIDIKDLDENIFIMKDTKVCPECGHKNNKKSLYCNICGSRLYNIQENNTEYSSEIISDLDLESESDQNIDIN
ncbi:MAG: zinc ribbon domain-containing protein [Oscillospiraceae bacterium]|nr:zinc ribbon domain-containing protein [Oscillospiraceae bacterium]